MPNKPAPDQLLYYLFCGAFFAMPFGTSPFTILGMCILLVWLVTGECIRKRGQYMEAPWFWPVVAIVALTWLGLIWSADPGGLGLKYAKKTHYWLYALIVSGIGFSGKAPRHLMNAFLGGLVINACVAFLQLANIVPTFGVFGRRFFTGFYSGYNTLAILLILGMLTASFIFRKCDTVKQRVVYGLLILAYFLQFIILDSRGGYLAFFLLSPIIVYNLLGGKKIFFIILAYLLVIAVMGSSPVVQERFSHSMSALRAHFNKNSQYATGKKYSYHIDRIYMWRWAFDLFTENPLLGVGTGGYKEATLSGGGEEGIDHPHNNFLFVAVSYGLLGIIVFGWFFWVLLKTGWRHRDHIFGFFILSSCLVILVGGLTNTHILDSGGAFLLAVTTGLVSALPREKPAGSAIDAGDKR